MRSAWADIDVQLRRRHDLVPQLVAAVKGYASHERSTLERVTELRSQAVGLRSPARLGEVESALGRALAGVMVWQEAYPNLKANETFLQLQRDLVEIEDHLQYARRFYNGAVRDYHNAIQRVPGLLIARTCRFGPSEFFQAGEEDRPPVPVELPR
jgi:LemA protein